MGKYPETNVATGWGGAKWSLEVPKRKTVGLCTLARIHRDRDMAEAFTGDNDCCYEAVAFFAKWAGRRPGRGR